MPLNALKAWPGHFYYIQYQLDTMTKAIFVKRLLPALLGASLMSAAHAAAPVIDFGVADGYNAFFYSNVSNATDVEGRMAVGGNLSTGGFSVGYRRAYGSAGP